MLQTVLEIINFCVLLYFGIYVCAAFLGIELTKKNNGILFMFGLALFALQIASYVYLGMEFTEKAYPLIAHLPLLLLFMLYFKQKALSSLFAVLSAYLCCQASKWLAMIVFSLSSELWVMYAVRIAITVPIWYTIIRYASKSLHNILSKSRSTLLIFGILPAVYYIFDYATTVYTKLLYGGSQAAFEFLPFLLCIAYLFFSVVYFKEYEKKCAAEQQKKLAEIQTAQSLKEIEEIKRSKYEISLIRHDMRHFLCNVSSMLESKDYEMARDYIKQIIEVTDQTALHKFCENEMVNMILSSYESRMADRSIRFDAAVAIPAVLPCSELEFTSILSNGLENAVNAVSGIEEDSRAIRLRLRMKNGKLLLSIHNPVTDVPKFKDGLPVTDMAGHGLGTQSIKYITTKLNGSCQFAVDNGIFTLRIVL